MYVSNDIVSRNKHVQVKGSIDLWSGTFIKYVNGRVYSVRWKRRPKADARCKASILSRDDVGKQLYTFVNEVAGDINGKIGLLTLYD